MAIFGFKKRKDEKLEQNAQATKAVKPVRSSAVKTAAKPKVNANKSAPKTDERQKVMAAPSLASEAATHSASVIIRPRVTEKSGLLSQGGVYTFEVARNSNKQSISKAIVALYKVTPVKIAIINSPSKNVFVKGRRGVVAGTRKAMVTVKKGDKIDFV